MPNYQGDKILLTADEAIALLPDKGRIHTFRNPCGMLVGADWDRAELEAAIRDSERREVTGETAQGFGHGLAIFDRAGVLFIEAANWDTIPVRGFDPIAMGREAPDGKRKDWWKVTRPTSTLRAARRGNTMAALKSGAPMAPAKKQPDTKQYSGRLAARIRELREAAGLTVEQVAERMTGKGYQLSAPTLYHWENGTRQPQLDALPILAKVLKTELAELFPKR